MYLRYFVQFLMIHVKDFLTWALWICLTPLWAHINFWPHLHPTLRSFMDQSCTQGMVHTYACFPLLPGYFCAHLFVLPWGETVSCNSLIILVILLLSFLFLYILLMWDDCILQVMFKMWMHNGFIYRHDDVFSFVLCWTWRWCFPQTLQWVQHHHFSPMDINFYLAAVIWLPCHLVLWDQMESWNKGGSVLVLYLDIFSICYSPNSFLPFFILLSLLAQVNTTSDGFGGSLEYRIAGVYFLPACLRSPFVCLMVPFHYAETHESLLDLLTWTPSFIFSWSYTFKKNQNAHSNVLNIFLKQS